VAVESEAGEEALALALFVGSWLPLSETFIYGQLRAQRRFRAHVFARRIDRTAAHFPYPHVTALGAVAGARYFFTGRSSTIASQFARLRPRLAHAHFGLNGVLALPFARAHGVPLVVSFHGHDVPGLLARRPSLRYARYRRLAAQLFEYASVLLCASGELAELLTQRAGAPAHKVEVHRLGVELADFPEVARDPDTLRVLMIGRLVEKKGMRYGIAAFAKLLARHPGARLVIVGDGPLRAALARCAQQLGIAHAVSFLGAVPAERVRAELAAASILLAPSVVARDGDRESGMIVVKEAAAARLPVVASRHGGIPEIIEHGHSGFLAAERDVETLARHLLELAADRSLRLEIGLLARAKIEREYDGRSQNELLERRLLRCLGERAPHGAA